MTERDGKNSSLIGEASAVEETGTPGCENLFVFHTLPLLDRRG